MVGARGTVSVTESVVQEVIMEDDTIKNAKKSIFFMILRIKNWT
jgi:hypothetical protein